MRRQTCEACGASFAAGELFIVVGRTLCEKCADALIAEGKIKLQPGDVRRHVDPTVCGWCSADHGEVELSPIVGVPACGPCATRMRNWPYPLWIKASFAALLCLAVASFGYNFRFFKAYVYARQAHKAEDFGRQADLTIAAAALVPESKELRDQADVFRALNHLMQGEDAQALALLQRLQVSMPHQPGLQRLILQAEAGVAFDKKNYDQYFEKCSQIAAMNPGEVVGLAGMASAYACKFAVTGNEDYKRQALENLAAAERVSPGGDPQFADMKNRIEFRLATREIVDNKEFQNRFPHGWKAGEAKP